METMKMEMKMKMETTKRKETPHIVLQVLEKPTVNIPEEMIMEILSRLPARSVGRLRCVSKTWLSFSTSHSFVRSHTQRSTQQSLIIERQNRNDFHFASADANADNGIALYNPTTRQRLKGTIVEASWHGFLCLRNSKNHQHSLFNPLTCQSINLPNSMCHSTLFLGLYLHRSTSKYRLIRLISANRPIKIEVLVVGESSWRRIPGFLPAFHQHPHPVEFNGRLHWLASTQRNVYRPPFRDYKVLPNTIMTFDTETENCNLLPLPPIKKTRTLGGNLIDFNRELGMWNIDDHCLNLWIMECSNWVKRYSVDFLKAPKVRHRLFAQTILTDPWTLGVAVPVGDEELLIDLSATFGECFLGRVNLKHGTCRVLLQRIGRRLTMSFPYAESLTHIKCNSLSILPHREWVFRILSAILLISCLYFMLRTL